MRPKKNVKMKDIADALGVSVASVSYALTGKKDVGETLRQKVIAKAKELGYRYTAEEKRETRKKVRIVYENPASSAGGVSAAKLSGILAAHGLAAAGRTEEAEGTLVIRQNGGGPLEEISLEGFSVTVLAGADEDALQDVAAPAVFTSTEHAVPALGRMGAVRPALLCRENAPNALDRYLGFLCGGELWKMENPEKSVYRSVEALLDSRPLPDAVLCADASSAAALRDALQNIPEDIMVIPCCSREEAERLGFSKALVPDTRQILETAAAILEKRLSGEPPAGFHAVPEIFLEGEPG